MIKEAVSGTVDHWDDAKGFGFVKADDGRRVFFHIRDLRADARPALGDRLQFCITVDEQGRQRASRIELAAVGFARSASLTKDLRREAQGSREKIQSNKKKTTKPDSRSSSSGRSWVSEHSVPWLRVAILLILPMIVVAKTWYSPFNYGDLLGWSLGQICLGLGVVMSAVTYVAYWSDKRRAQLSEWRIPENTLHLLSLLSGWPGAYIAQQQYRHKTKKLSFRVVYWGTVLSYQLVCLDVVIFKGQGWERLLYIVRNH